MISVTIEVKNGKVVITVGGQASSNAQDATAVVAQGAVGNQPVGKPGGSGASEDTSSGGGIPGSGAVVVGPIVVDFCTPSQGSNGKSGGSGASEDTGSGGSGASEDTSSGGATPGSGVVVIGPLVITRNAGGATVASSSGAAKPLSILP